MTHAKVPARYRSQTTVDGFLLSQWCLNLDQLRKWSNLVTNTLKYVQNMMPVDHPCK